MGNSSEIIGNLGLVCLMMQFTGWKTKHKRRTWRIGFYIK